MRRWLLMIVHQFAFLKKFEVDLAFLDATFWSGDELMKRDMKEVPHPTVQES